MACCGRVAINKFHLSGYLVILHVWILLDRRHHDNWKLPFASTEALSLFKTVSNCVDLPVCQMDAKEGFMGDLMWCVDRRAS